MQGGGDSATPKGIKADSNMMITGGGNYISARGVGSVGVEAGYNVTVDGGVTYAFGTAKGIACGKAAYTDGYLLAGGTVNSVIPGAIAQSLTGIGSGTVSSVMSETGSKLLGSFRWPVAMASASLICLRP